jgi:hypothetical protein
VRDVFFMVADYPCVLRMCGILTLAQSAREDSERCDVATAQEYVTTDDHGVMRVAESGVMLDSVIASFQEGCSAETIAQQYNTRPSRLRKCMARLRIT